MKSLTFVFASIALVSCAVKAPQYGDASYASYMDVSVAQKGDTSLLVSEHEWRKQGDQLQAEGIPLYVRKEGPRWLVELHGEKSWIVEGKEPYTLEANFSGFTLIFY